jgi:hypothetical protein
MNLGEQLVVLIEDSKDVVDDVDAAPGLVELSETDNACLQLRNEVDAHEREVFPGLAGEDASVMPFYHRDGAVTELDSVVDVRVELGEQLLAAGHVVHCAGVRA